MDARPRLPAAGGDDGSHSFMLPKGMKSGTYAVAITNNQYIWPFEIKR